MRRIIRFAMPLALLAISASSFAGDQTVYATEKGKRYHVKNCRMKSGSKAIKLSEAKKKGYTACAVCKPPK